MRRRAATSNSNVTVSPLRSATAREPGVLGDYEALFEARTLAAQGGLE
jgi:hypothetical protein